MWSMEFGCRLLEYSESRSSLNLSIRLGVVDRKLTGHRARKRLRIVAEAHAYTVPYSDTVRSARDDMFTTGRCRI